MNLAGLREQYRRDLFDDFLPFMDRFVIDHEHGGFLCHADRDGTCLGDEKDSWYTGRGIWVYAFLYRHLTHDPLHLEVARKAAAFALRIRPPDDPRWPRTFTRTGETLAPDGEIYGSLFIAEGLAEFSAAAAEPRYWDTAKEIALACRRVYDRPDYEPNTRHYLGPDAPPFPGARVLGASMLLLRLATQMLRTRADEELEALAARALEEILERHYNPAYGLCNEFLNHDYGLPRNAYEQFCYTSHAAETLWMVMDEALRRGDDALFDLAAERFRRHVEVSWDDVYGGILPGLKHVDRNEWFLEKFLWAQAEVLVGCMMLMEHRRDPWACEMFARLYGYVRQRYPLAPHGLPLWITAADRKVTFEPHYHRIENYHHPRHLMLNLLALERMTGA